MEGAAAEIWVRDIHGESTRNRNRHSIKVDQVVHIQRGVNEIPLW